MAKYAFLSDEWVAEARRIRAEYVGALPPSPISIRMNQVVRGVPWPPGTLEAHLDTTGGDIDLETGHLDAPDLTVTTDYDTARAIFVGGDMQVAMGAFLGGKIKVDGDISKLLSLQSSGAVGSLDPGAVEMARRIQEMTE